MIFRLRPVLTVFAAAGMAVLIALGVWQLHRLSWKFDLIRKVEDRIGADAMTFEGANKLWSDHQDAEYLPVYQEGVFLHDLEAHVFGARDGIPGYYIFTPLELSGFPSVAGARLYVNRGFAPQALKDSELRKDGQVSGLVTVYGLFRTPSPPSRGLASAFEPVDDPVGNIWYRRDPQAFAEPAGILTLPVYIDSYGEENPAAWPKGGTTRLDFSNRHLAYALTWFGLAGALFAVWLAYSLQRR